MRQGECPCCGSNNLDYGSVDFYDDQCGFPRDCMNCKASGMEWYSMDFIEHDIYEEGVLPTNQKEDDRVENWKDDLFDDLNNILFSRHSELTEYIKKWLIKHKLVDDDRIVGELASEFIDQKELYDLDYED